MNISTAKEITKPFFNMKAKRYPLLASDWEFILEDESVYLISKENNVKYYFSSINTYAKMYMFGVFKDDILNNKLKKSAYFTSIGFVSVDDFFLAEDMLENSQFIPRKDLLLNKVYLTDKGKEYLYINISEKNIFMKEYNLISKENKSWNAFIDLSTSKIIKGVSLKFIDMIDKEIYFIRPIFPYSINEILYRKIIYSHENVEDSLFSTINNFSKRENINNVEEFMDFIKNNKKTFIIEKKINKKDSNIAISSTYANDLLFGFFIPKNIIEKENIFNYLNGLSLALLKSDIFEKISSIELKNIFEELYNFNKNIFDKEHCLVSPQGFRAIFKTIYEFGSSDLILEVISNFNWRNKDTKKYKGSVGFKNLENDLKLFVSGIYRKK